ncbi:MAG: phospho-sugar mutase [Atribacterota bacterium]|nr:phospho-sugar mutase [Atribacterota bacterium]
MDFQRDYKEKYKQWLNSPTLSNEAKNELQEISDKEDEIQDRFYKDLEFGTGGMRGKIGMGTNRMNIYTVGKSTQGLADYLLENIDNASSKGVVIAYDPRYKSREFSERAAGVLTANGIKVYLFTDIRPTPELSFAVRELDAAAGIVITASHNPPEYNGYKVYGDNAAQVLPEVADRIIEKINQIIDYSEIRFISPEEAEKSNLLINIGEDIDRLYYKRVMELTLSHDVDKNINIVYTPLHGTGNIPVRTILKEIGYNNVFVDEEQAKPDPEFPTVDSPNPENPDAFRKAVELGKEMNADILIATDPDCDRIALAVSTTQYDKQRDTISPHSHCEESFLFSRPSKEHSDEAIQSPDAKSNYLFLNGNQTGALLIDYILKRKSEDGHLPENGFIMKTIVTSEMGRVVADSYGIPTYDTLTGFKFICNKAMELEKQGKTFLFGYEESIGYLTGNFVQDKDAVICAMLIVEMAAYYKKKGLSLLDILNRLYERHGYFLEHLDSIILEGLEGEQQMAEIMASFREEFPDIPEMKVSRKIDYKTPFQYDYETNEKEIIDIPQSDVLKCVFSDDSWYAIRPSGTEPKIKIYMSMTGKTKKEAQGKLKILKSAIFGKIESIIK